MMSDHYQLAGNKILHKEQEFNRTPIAVDGQLGASGEQSLVADVGLVNGRSDNVAVVSDSRQLLIELADVWQWRNRPRSMSCQHKFGLAVWGSGELTVIRMLSPRDRVASVAAATRGKRKSILNRFRQTAKELIDLDRVVMHT